MTVRWEVVNMIGARINAGPLHSRRRAGAVRGDREVSREVAGAMLSYFLSSKKLGGVEHPGGHYRLGFFYNDYSFEEIDHAEALDRLFQAEPQPVWIQYLYEAGDRAKIGFARGIFSPRELADTYFAARKANGV